MTTTEVATGYSKSQTGTRTTRRRRAAWWPVSLLPVDALTITAAVVLAEFAAGGAHVPPTRLSALIGFPALTLAALAFRGSYRRRGARISIFQELRAVLTLSALAAMVTLSVRAFLTTDPAIAQQGARLWAYAAAFMAAGRVTHFLTEQSARRAGEGLKPTLIIGAGRVGRLTAERLHAMPEVGLKPIGFLDKDPLAPTGHVGVLPVLGASWDLEEVVRAHGVEQVIISFSRAPNHVLLRLMRRCEELGIAVSTVPRLYEQTTNRLTVEHLGGLPLVSAHPANPRGFQFAVKYAADRLVSATLILFLSPILAAGAISTYLSLGRPIFFRQRRVGRDGVEFDMLKFRTMRGMPEERGETDADWAQQQLNGGGPANINAACSEEVRSQAGKLMRRLSIDELPQLFNVLAGHMSIVGPRPERVHYVRQFESNIYRYGDRHRVKSGITGWAQANGLRGKTSLTDRVEWDNYYIENFSLWLDAKILLMTFAAVLTGFKTVD
jgi:exopolysaccharide biosynthesis polyprenyl glycosylphosphotransferase